MKIDMDSLRPGTDIMGEPFIQATVRGRTLTIARFPLDVLDPEAGNAATELRDFVITACRASQARRARVAKAAPLEAC